ncbi:MAG TPA: hypothetical protein VGN15_10510, partial [Ktedonobacteraceae bacterium]|nr:hypothetical protein [Ktedonobacteraceae bacterium]
NSLSHIRQDKGHLMDDSDIIIKLSMWVQEQRLRTKGADVVVNFNDLDAQLKLPHGSTARLIGEAVSNSNYTIHTKSATSMLLRYSYSIG